MIELGLAIGNGLVAFSGALIAQYQGFADVAMGLGTMVTGMAAVILGETLRRAGKSLVTTITMVAIGALLFRCWSGSRSGWTQSDRSQAHDGGVRARALALPARRGGGAGRAAA
jgi:hypothetical protein